MEALTLVRNRVPRYEDTYVLDLPTKGALAAFPAGSELLWATRRERF